MKKQSLIGQLLAVNLVFISSLATAADTTPSEMSDLNLGDLLNLPITVASLKPLTANQSPGIITVISRDEIMRSGARDLPDVLALVPGFQVGADYFGTESLGIRGQWSLEGKFMILLDGQEMNETYYNSFMINNHIPVDSIERIEIMRGPGSAIYGNAAELAVISIITKTGEQLNGARVAASVSAMSNTYGYKNVNLSYGKRYGTQADDLDVSLKYFHGTNMLSNRNRTYPDGSVITMLDNYVQTGDNLNFGVTYKNFSARFILDNLATTAIDINEAGGPNGFTGVAGTALTSPATISYYNWNTDFKYEWKPESISSHLTITPEFWFKRSAPYFNTQTNLTAVDGTNVSSTPAGSVTIVNWDIRADRYRWNLPVSYDITKDLNLIAGLEYYIDQGGTNGIELFYTDPNNLNQTATSVSYNNSSLYEQLIWSTDLGIFTLGSRFEHHSYVGNSFAPRFAWTKELGDWNFKLLLNRSFRAPSVGNINDAAQFGSTIKPEFTTAEEIEVGYNLTKSDNLKINVFNTITDSPIVYTFDYYINGGATGSRGLEFQWKHTQRSFRSNLAYSFYTTAGINNVAPYGVTQSPIALSGFANHAVTWNASYEAINDFWINPTLFYYGPRYSYMGPYDSQGRNHTGLMDPCFLANLYLSYNPSFLKGLELGTGVFNIFDAAFDYGYAYDLARNPMPSSSRQFAVRAGYNFSL